MNRLDPPAFLDDHAALKALSENNGVGSYPKLAGYLTPIDAGYTRYAAAKGDATAIARVAIPGKLGKLLIGHYKQPPNDLSYITRMRDESRVDTCPMCGAFFGGTLDHILPKARYKAFAVLGLNLVPACGCNSRRGDDVRGSGPGERILHPYFDDILRERILAAQFEDPGPAPRISVRILQDPGSPDYPAIKFHYDNLIMRTDLVRYLRKFWGKLISQPSVTVTRFREIPRTWEALDQMLREELQDRDDKYESRNNWESILIAGLLDANVQAWLYPRLNRPGRRPKDPLEV
ncbi:HNH endonuclease signature motif containing protein [Caulobacter hibisci]|uniref:HNH endonuclease n=1 Tax=Caulobacter hibisci TaxID=2035993 RepID=A0ABS0T210_9CAUL|nr:HNH endonuclease signature motif containing protein [Caulobacter hibisci]MBI1685916.1 HNH endonuclease [Caulobacter hibisci]